MKMADAVQVKVIHYLLFSLSYFWFEGVLVWGYEDPDEPTPIEVFELTHPTTWKEMSSFYNAVEKQWKICVNCGVPGLGTAMHMEHIGASTAMYPAAIPTEYLLTRLAIIDVTGLTRTDQRLTLTLDVARQWHQLKRDPKESTILLFKFGWTEDWPNYTKHTCVCSIPGLSVELAEYIATNLSHVVGVATDAPTLESDDSRGFTSKTVATTLGRSGIYMIENVNLRKRVPERGCMALAMPLKMLNMYYVPTRLTAFCPPKNNPRNVVMALKLDPPVKKINSRGHVVRLEELL